MAGHAILTRNFVKGARSIEPLKGERIRTPLPTNLMPSPCRPRQPRIWNPKIDCDLATICLKSLEKNPQYRYPSALALAEDLERWLRYEPIHARRTGVFGRGKKWVRRNPTIALLILSLTALTAAVSWNVWKSEFVSSAAPTGVAVLPFENLSDDTENAFFADGVQDDVLTKLA